MRYWVLFCKFVARIASITLFGVRVYGCENVPISGSVLMASNHQSYLDPIFLGVSTDREVYFMARKTLFRNMLFGALLSSLNVFPVERDYADIKSVRKSLELLGDGKAVAIFPEGTRSYDGNIGKIKSGIGLLAERANAQIIPVLVEGSYKVWSRNNILPSCGKVNIIWGKPVMLNKADVVERLYELFDKVKQVRRRQI